MSHTPCPYHLIPPSGWCNDPNGVIWRNGRLHVFYQHDPKVKSGGAMHWGHASSADLLHWEHHPIALSPDAPYEQHPEGGGCWSGSAIVTPDDQLALVYTGHGHDGQGEIETQCVAFSRDDMQFAKHPGNPVLLPGDRYPANSFRDPKVWRHDGRYYMVVGTKHNGPGAVAIFASDDLFRWDDLGILYQSESPMCECPDFFELDGRHVLIYSPIGQRPRAVVGDFDTSSHKFRPSSQNELDLGPDFYAPQTTLDDEGRRLMIGWLGNWGRDIPPAMKAAGFAWTMTLPRVLKLSEERVISIPAPSVGEPCRRPFAPGDTLAFGDLTLSVEAHAVTVRQPITPKGERIDRTWRHETEHPAGQAFIDRWSVELQFADGCFATFAAEQPIQVEGSA